MSAVLFVGMTGAWSTAAAQAPVAGPGSAAGFHTGTRGVGDDGTRPAADLAAGYDLRVDPAARHAARIGSAMEYAVGQLRRYGIDVRYRGIAVVPEDASTYGQITVGETVDPADPVCTAESSHEQGVIIDATTVPSFQDVGIASRVNAAQITFCPPMWNSDQDYVRAIAMHELGHAVGLGHFSGTYRGAVQIMSPGVPDVPQYQAGDIHGLRYLVAQTAALRAASRVQGEVDSWLPTRSGLDVTGWAIVGTTYQFANIDVTRDGETVYAITTGGPRPDITARYGARWPNSGFHGSEIAMPSGVHRYCIEAAVPTAPDDRTTLGCRDLGPPPEVRTPAGTATTEPSRHAKAWATWIVAGGAALSLGLVLAALRRIRKRQR